MKIIILENLQIMFPNQTLDLRNLTPEERKIVIEGVKNQTVKQGIKIQDMR